MKSFTEQSDGVVSLALWSESSLAGAVDGAVAVGLDLCFFSDVLTFVVFP